MELSVNSLMSNIYALNPKFRDMWYLNESANELALSKVARYPFISLPIGKVKAKKIRIAQQSQLMYLEFTLFFNVAKRITVQTTNIPNRYKVCLLYY